MPPNANSRWSGQSSWGRSGRMEELVPRLLAMYLRVRGRISFGKARQIADLTSLRKCLTWMVKIPLRQACWALLACKVADKCRTPSLWTITSSPEWTIAKISILRWHIISTCQILIMASLVTQVVSNNTPNILKKTSWLHRWMPFLPLWMLAVACRTLVGLLLSTIRILDRLIWVRMDLCAIQIATSLKVAERVSLWIQIALPKAISNSSILECNETARFKITNTISLQTCSHQVATTVSNCHRGTRTLVGHPPTCILRKAQHLPACRLSRMIWWEDLLIANRQQLASASKTCKRSKTSVILDKEASLSTLDIWLPIGRLTTHSATLMRQEVAWHCWRSECLTVVTVSRKLRQLSTIVRPIKLVAKFMIRCRGRPTVEWMTLAAIETPIRTLKMASRTFHHALLALTSHKSMTTTTKVWVGHQECSLRGTTERSSSQILVLLVNLRPWKVTIAMTVLRELMLWL